jgi:hypothetical protein
MFIPHDSSGVPRVESLYFYLAVTAGIVPRRAMNNPIFALLRTCFRVYAAIEGQPPGLLPRNAPGSGSDPLDRIADPRK